MKDDMMDVRLKTGAVSRDRCHLAPEAQKFDLECLKSSHHSL